MSLLRKSALLVLLLFVMSGLAATAASACTNTRPNNQPHHYWDGMYENADGSPYSCFFGVQTPSLYTTNPSVLSPDGGGETSSSSAWVGLDFQSSGSAFAFGQDGWIKFYNGNYNYFNEIANQNGAWKSGFYGTIVNGSYHDFKVTYSYSDNTFHFFWNGALQYDWQYSPAQLGCNYAIDGEAEGEITSAHNQMPGTQDNPETINAVEVMSNGGSWTSGSGWTPENSDNSWFYDAIGYSSGDASSTFYDKCN